MGVPRSVHTILLALLGVALFCSAGAALLFKYLDAAPVLAAGAVPAPQVANVEVEDGGWLVQVLPGESETALGKRLKTAGLIRSTLLWSVFARLDARPVKAGYYRVARGVSAHELWNDLAAGHQLLVKVTVPEGYTLKKTAELIEKRGVATASDFLAAASDSALVGAYGIPAKTLEGFLYPDTYLFPKSFPADRIVRAMADNFFKKLAAVSPQPLSSMTPKQLFDRVVVASIVEREYREDDEAALIAGVFFNRLKIRMALQSCATIEYIITEIEGKPHPEVIYNRDLAIKDPYNTYANAGLPPGPISLPGKVALDAAFNPRDSDFLYFRLVDPKEGRHHFSKTLEEHLEAGTLYLKKASS